jgi:hypothetical protein
MDGSGPSFFRTSSPQGLKPAGVYYGNAIAVYPPFTGSTMYCLPA